MFSAISKSTNLNLRFEPNRLFQSPLVSGTWAILAPAGLQNHAPQLCWINEASLACVWMAGGQEGTAGMSIFMSILREGKTKWSRAKLISQDSTRSEQNPLLFLTPNNKVNLLHTAQHSRDLSDNTWRDTGSTFSMQWTALIRSQCLKNSGVRWSKAIDLLDTPAFCRNPPYRLPDSTLLLPIYRSLETGGAFGSDYSEVVHLDSDGVPTGNIYPVPNSTGRVHGSIVSSCDGKRLIQFFRSRMADKIYRSVGSEDGLIWSTPEPTILPNNNSSVQSIRLLSGRLAMIFNRFSYSRSPSSEPVWGEAHWPRTRWPLSIALSEDDGISWPWILDLDTGNGYAGVANWHLNGQLAYPTILEGLPGELHIAYSWAGRAAIRYVCINEELVLGDSSFS